MRTFILSTGFAAAMGAFAVAPASAAPISTHGVLVAPVVTDNVACVVKKKTVIRNGVKRVTTVRDCGPVARRTYIAPRRYYRPARPGITVRVR
ncbi:hypothetical protein [Chenggangzhangella methanolivorans]|uniref:Uncharacterized protein n=1 Tax=Chenggangzhangella methanolivorans TaxID=1437009 RepID=A0A9E6RDZ8_9HYPH|nr:hypothetical protein [Chenggangzhangella methanolivorans]QZO01633.1 hypothetical protein K6K41_09645 [Chenggangzhangella methanolivorans]